MRQSRGFTLLEVLVAVAILGLGLATILSAQAGAFASAAHARHLSVATSLLRCKMSELEEHLYRDGFQLTDENGEGPCCDLDETPDMHCLWRVESPQFPDAQLGDMDLQSSLSLGSGAGSGSGAGALGALGLLSGAGSGSGSNPLGGASSITDIATTLANANSSALAGTGATPIGGVGSSAPLGYAAPAGTSASGTPTSTDGSDGSGDGMGGLASMAMSIVYPSLKLLFEASTRRITTTLVFHEGKKEYTIDVVEWFCLPQQGLTTDDGSGATTTTTTTTSSTKSTTGTAK